MHVLNPCWAIWERSSARGFWEARGQPSRAKSLSSFPPSLSPQLLNQRREESQIPPRAWSSFHPAKPDRLSVPACSLTLTRTHTEHSSWEPRERAAGCAPKKLQSSLLFLRRSADGMSSRYLLAPLCPHTAFTCCLFLSCSHMDAWRWDMSVSFSSLIHCLISEEMHFSCCYLLNNFKAYSISSGRLIPAEKKSYCGDSWNMSMTDITRLVYMKCTPAVKKASFFF